MLVRMSDDHLEGLAHDLPALVGRRRALSLLGGVGLTALAACAPGTTTQDATSPATPTGSPPNGGPPPANGGSSSVGAGEVPEETNGPFPADGSNGVNVLTESGVVRSDIRSSFGDADGAAEGVPLTVTLTVIDVSSATDPGSAVAGAAIYAWHCDRDGKYSMYDAGLRNENYLRGVQQADASGQVTFQTIFPGAYSGRWPHIHFEVFESMDNATAAGQVLAVSQIALTEASCREVYASAGYESSARNFPRTTLTSDNVFGDDGGIYQLATMTGSVSGGYTAGLNVTV